MNIRERLFQLRLSRPLGRNRLGVHRADVVLQRHRRRADVRTLAQRPQRSVAADIRQPIDMVAEHRGPGRRDLLPLPKRDEAILKNRHRQAEVIGNRAAALRADARQKLEDQVLDQRFADPGVFERRRFLRLKAIVEAECRNQRFGTVERCGGSHSILTLAD